MKPLDHIDEANKVILGNYRIVELVDKEKIWSINIPEEHRKVESAPLIRINDVMNKPYDFSSDRPLNYVWIVYVNIWSVELETINEIGMLMDKSFEENDWTVADGDPIEPDADMEELYIYGRVYRKIKQV